MADKPRFTDLISGAATGAAAAATTSPLSGVAPVTAASVGALTGIARVIFQGAVDHAHASGADVNQFTHALDELNDESVATASLDNERVLAQLESNPNVQAQAASLAGRDPIARELRNNVLAGHALQVARAYQLNQAMRCDALHFAALRSDPQLALLIALAAHGSPSEFAADGAFEHALAPLIEQRLILVHHGSMNPTLQLTEQSAQPMHALFLHRIRPTLAVKAHAYAASSLAADLAPPSASDNQHSI